MKRVLMLLDKEFPQDDRVEKEANSLISEGFEVFLLCPDFSGREKEEQYGSIKVKRFSINKSLFNKLLGLIQLFPFYKYLWLAKADRIIQKFRIEIVHLHDLPLCCLTRSLSKRNLKIVADMHENYPAMVKGQEHMKKLPNKYLISVKKWYQLEKKWLQSVDLIICTASGMIDRMSALLGKSKNFILVPNTIDIDEFSKTQKTDPDIEKRFSEDNFIILSYGVVSEHRGIQYVLKAIQKLKTKIPELKFLVLGDGSYLNFLKDLASELQVEEHVIFEGWQNQSLLISYLKHTDLCIIPHIKSEHTDNTSPNKLFHFMYFGKPVVASNCNYIEEIVEDENCGLVYKYDDDQEMADAIVQLYKDKEKRIQMGVNGKQAVLTKYNWKATSEVLVQSYNGLVIN